MLRFSFLNIAPHGDVCKKLLLDIYVIVCIFPLDRSEKCLENNNDECKRIHESEARVVAAEPIIVVRNLSKAFPGVQALKDVQFDLYPGEVHTLVGENGAGKSTLMKILSGVYQRDSGEILVGGRPVEIHNPRAAQRLGISIIHQELNLMNHLTAAQNIFIGKEPRRAGGFLLDEKAINAKAKELFDMLHVDWIPE